jgi:hypothetical protein
LFLGDYESEDWLEFERDNLGNDLVNDIAQSNGSELLRARDSFFLGD